VSYKCGSKCLACHHDIADVGDSLPRFFFLGGGGLAVNVSDRLSWISEKGLSYSLCFQQDSSNSPV
jgi:hypothetical protein